MENFSKKIIRKVGKFIRTNNLIVDNDKILVALSGGKDSSVLLDILVERLKYLPIKYEILGVHIDFGFNDCEVEDVINLCNSLNIKHYIKKVKITPPKEDDVACFWCSWNRRKALFDVSKELKCQKLIMGHHLDDAAETILLNMFYQSKFWCFSPKEVFFKGELEIIRPLLVLDENEIIEYARLKGIEYKNHICPYNVTNTKRNLFKKTLKGVFNDSKDIKKSIYNSWIKRSF